MSSSSRSRALTATTPTRVDLAGGTLDLWPLYLFFEGCRTLNAAIDILSSVRLETIPSGFEIESRDQGRRVRAASLDELEADGELPLPVRLVRHFAPEPGLRVITEGRSPAGAGLGGSSSLAVALAGALAEWSGRPLQEGGLLTLVANLEAQVLRTPTGVQDYYAALQGGVGVLRLEPGGVRRDPLPDVDAWLGPRLVLCYTGAPHQSGIRNWEVYRRAVEGDRGTCEALAGIAAAAREMEESVLARDAERVAQALGREWEARRKLAPGVTTPRIEEICARALGQGALAAKVCGAGGGGCLLLVAREGRAEDLGRDLRAQGVEVLPFRLEPRGLSVSWR